MPDLNCTEFEAQLEQLVEDHQTLEDLSEEPTDPVWRDLRAHANACSHCRQLWNDFALLERVMVPWKDSLPPVDLADAVLGRWKAENPSHDQTAPAHASPPSPSAKRSLWPMLLVVVAAIVLSFRFWDSPPTEEGMPPTIETKVTNADNSFEEQPKLPEPRSQNAPGPEEKTPEMDWDTLAQDARSAYWVLASDTADAFATVSVLVPPQKPAKNPDLVPADKPKKGWTEEIGSGFKPIGQDIGRATGFLLDALPTL